MAGKIDVRPVAAFAIVSSRQADENQRHLRCPRGLHCLGNERRLKASVGRIAFGIGQFGRCSQLLQLGQRDIHQRGVDARAAAPWKYGCVAARPMTATRCQFCKGRTPLFLSKTIPSAAALRASW